MVTTLGSLRVDRLFLGAHGTHVEAGLTTRTLVLAQVNHALVASSRSVCVLADHTKIGIVALSIFMPVSDVDTLITDPGIPDRARAALEEGGVQLPLARPTTVP